MRQSIEYIKKVSNPYLILRSLRVFPKGSRQSKIWFRRRCRSQSFHLRREMVYHGMNRVFRFQYNIPRSRVIHHMYRFFRPTPIWQWPPFSFLPVLWLSSRFEVCYFGISVLSSRLVFVSSPFSLEWLEGSQQSGNCNSGSSFSECAGDDDEYSVSDSPTLPLPSYSFKLLEAVRVDSRLCNWPGVFPFLFLFLHPFSSPLCVSSFERGTSEFLSSSSGLASRY